MNRCIFWKLDLDANYMVEIIKLCPLLKHVIHSLVSSVLCCCVFPSLRSDLAGKPALETCLKILDRKFLLVNKTWIRATKSSQDTEIVFRCQFYLFCELKLDARVVRASRVTLHVVCRTGVILLHFWGERGVRVTRDGRGVPPVARDSHSALAWKMQKNNACSAG